MCVCVCVCVCVGGCGCGCLSFVCLSVHLSVRLSACLSVYLLLESSGLLPAQGLIGVRGHKGKMGETVSDSYCMCLVRVARLHVFS